MTITNDVSVCESAEYLLLVSAVRLPTLVPRDDDHEW
jgi:hypothetical protein